MSLRLSLLASVVSASLLAACSSADDPAPGDGYVAPGGERRLKTLDDGEAFLDALRTGLIAQANTRAQYGYPEDSLGVPVAQPTEPASGAPGNDSDAAVSESSGSSNEVTTTNVQEMGVDEQDWVKLSADGNRLYVLDSTYTGYVYPFGVPAIDVEDDAVSSADGLSIPVPQSSQTTLRIMQLDVDSPDAQSLKDLSIPMDGRYAEGFYLYENTGKSQAVLTATGNNFWGYWAESEAFGGLDSLITSVDVSNPASATVTGTVRIDGQIVSSRRIGKYLFFASRFYPSIKGIQSYNVSVDQWESAVNNADAAELLPQFSRDDSGSTQPLIDPAACFVSDAASSADYYSPDIITLAVLDLETLQLSDSQCYLGASETLYASPDAVFLATTQYDYTTGPVAEDGRFIDVDAGEFPADIIWFDPRVDTDIHQFDIDAGQLVYAGSGTVRGHLGWNQLRKPFRMSEKDGYLRVATFNDRQGLNESPILLSVLKADGSGALVTVSSLPNENQPGFIGKPGEQLYASRFLGDRAYLVTFRQTDPLYVIDLADPARPFIAGELQIEGYSDYLHPIGPDTLLGIGKDAVPAPDSIGDGRGALVQGVKLSLFDVSDASSPREIQSVLIGQRGTDARALSDHRAITVQAATDQHPARVSFGIDVYGQASPSSSPTGQAVFTYHPWNYSGLHGFDIRTGTDAGITSRGVLVVQSAASGKTYPDYADDRSVMVNDSLFYIRGRSVYAAPWNDLGNSTPAR
ncbi:MAG: hypothetical protein HKN42_11575 [Granulosicoccus sp.]|nr:hypothetical protein [Granulosicoccus sp.]